MSQDTRIQERKEVLREISLQLVSSNSFMQGQSKHISDGQGFMAHAFMNTASVNLGPGRWAPERSRRNPSRVDTHSLEWAGTGRNGYKRMTSYASSGQKLTRRSEIPEGELENHLRHM